jgi:PAS domain S-box-containing protein
MGPQDIDDNPSYTKENLRKIFNKIMQNNQKKHIVNTVHRRKNGSVFPAESLVTPFPKKRIIIASVRDISERKKYQEEIQTHLKYKNALQKISRVLVSGFNDDDKIEKSLHYLRKISLQYLLDVSDVSRVYFFKNFTDPKDGLCMKQIDEVCAEGVSKEIDNPHLQHVPYFPPFQRWYETLSKNEPIYGLIKDFPKEEREVLEPQHIKSILIIPIFVYSKFYGFIGFDDIDKERVWDSENVFLLKTAAESIGSFIERKSSLIELKKSEEKFRSFVENANDIVYSLSPEGVFTYVSPNWTEIVGHSVDQVLGSSFEKFVHPDDMSSCHSFLEKIITSGKKQKGVEYRVKCTDGSYRWHTSNASPLKGENGNVVSFMGIGRDINDWKKTEAELKQSNEKFRTLFDQANDAVFLMNGKTFVDCNVKAEQVFKTTKEELIGKTPLDFSPELQPNGKTSEELANEKIQLAFNGQPQYFEWEHKIKGKTIICDLSLNIVSIDEKKLVLVLLRDITGRKKTEMEIKNKNEELRLMNQELHVAREQLTDLNENLERKVQQRTKKIEALLNQRNDFISDLGHDLRTPLGPLVSLLPLLRKRVSDEKNQEIIDLLSRNVDRMREMMNKTLKLSEVNAANVKFITEPINLKDFIYQVISLHHVTLSRKQLQVINNISKDIIVDADHKYFRELIQQLISNAIKYSDGEGNIIFDSTLNENMVKISISDNGIGMNGEQLNHVFDEFYKADQSRHDLNSSGLGLPICKRIVEKHGGQIWAESKGPGEGSTIFFTLPISE